MGKPSLDDVVSAYSRFVPHQILQLLGKKSVTEVILGESLEQRMTILFSDMRNFTAISEELSPRENFHFINSYLEHMEPVIARHNGIIDKYIGDAIMALFPTSADDALGGSIAMLHELARFNDERVRGGHKPIAIGIGLNTGLMMLGTVGGKSRMESTVISDAVNLASRIETMTKSYGVSILIAEHTYYSLRDASKYRIRFADRVRVKGKEQPQSIYEVFDADPPALRDAKERTIRTFERAIAYYYFRDVAKARDLFGQCLDECPDDTVAGVYRDRCDRFLETGIHEGTGEVDLAVAWSPGIAVGHPEIDEQHKKLFVATQEFVETVKKNRNFTYAAPLLRFLEEYTHDHFDKEYKIMEEHGYPFLDIQKEQHEVFIQQFEKLKIEIAGSSDLNFLLFKIQVLIIDWLIHHTSKSDRHFGRFLKLGESSGKEHSR